MKARFLISALLALLAAPLAHAQNVTVKVVPTCGAETIPTSAPSWLRMSATGLLCINGTFTGTVSSASTIADGADVGEGATTATAASVGGTGSVNAKLRLMTSQLDTINTTLGSGVSVTFAPSSSAAIGITPTVSGSAGSGLVLKATPGNVYAAYATNHTSTSGYLVLLNATSVPGDGAITPLACAALSSNGSASINYAPGPPGVYSVGIVAVVTSASTCFTKTTGTITAFIGGSVK